MALKKLMVKAVPLYQELQGLTSKPVKLSAKGCLAMALSIANCEESRILELSKRLDDDPESFRYTHMFIRNAMRWVKEPTFSGPIKDIRRYTWLAGRFYDSVIAELASLQSSIYELIAVAIYRVTQSNPEVFGTLDDISQYHARVAELNKKLDQICGEIESGYDRKDLQFAGPITQEGYVKITFKISNGEIPISEGCGKRLIEWACCHKDVLSD